MHVSRKHPIRELWRPREQLKEALCAFVFLIPNSLRLRVTALKRVTRGELVCQITMQATLTPKVLSSHMTHSDVPPVSWSQNSNELKSENNDRDMTKTLHTGYKAELSYKLSVSRWADLETHLRRSNQVTATPSFCTLLHHFLWFEDQRRKQSLCVTSTKRQQENEEMDNKDVNREEGEVCGASSQM